MSALGNERGFLERCPVCGAMQRSERFGRDGTAGSSARPAPKASTPDAAMPTLPGEAASAIRALQNSVWQKREVGDERGQ